MKLSRRPSVSLASETGMFLWIPSSLLSNGPLLSLLCTSRVRHCLHLLVVVVDWCVSRLVRLRCCQIEMLDCLLSNRFDSKQSRAVCWSASHLPSVSCLITCAFKIKCGQVSIVILGPLWCHRPSGYVSSFYYENCWFSGHSVVFRRLVDLRWFCLSRETGLYHPNSDHSPPLSTITDQFL